MAVSLLSTDLPPGLATMAKTVICRGMSRLASACPAARDTVNPQAPSTRPPRASAATDQPALKAHRLDRIMATPSSRRHLGRGDLFDHVEDHQAEVRAGVHLARRPVQDLGRRPLRDDHDPTAG